MDWRWTVRRGLISAFLVVHLSATLLWVVPECPIRQRTIGTVSCYIMPLGLWQFWTMFSPDPMRDTFTLEAEVVDAKGIRALFQFPKLADYSAWQGIPRFRHSKYAVNLMVDSLEPAREFAARHAVRQLHLPSGAFPVEVQLIYQVRPPQPPGEAIDLMTPTRRTPFATYQFASVTEVQP